MLSHKMRLGVVGVIVALSLAGCASKAKKSKSKSGYNEATTQGVSDEPSFSGDSSNTYTSDSASSGSSYEEKVRYTYHFGFDRYDVPQEDYNSIQSHADDLVNNPNKTVRIEGHTDPRGSREYNIALGERRAKAVNEILMSRGVKPNQVKVVSYGSEKPAARGDTEEDYAQDRRAIIVVEE